jgi:hypothetical protein
MTQILDRINEHNERRQELVKSGQATVHPEAFAKWETEELEKRSQFEKQMETATP